MFWHVDVLRRFEERFSRRHPLSHRQALAILDGLWAEGGDRCLASHGADGGARLAAALRRHGIPSMVIGGQAVLRYGEPRLTRDIDLTLGINSECLPEVLTHLAEARCWR